MKRSNGQSQYKITEGDACEEGKIITKAYRGWFCLDSLHS